MSAHRLNMNQQPGLPVDADRRALDGDVRRLARSLAGFVIALSLVFPFYAWGGWVRHGRIGLVTAMIAFAVCGLGGMAALVSGAWLQRRSPLGGALGGMCFRFGVPLVAAIVLSESFPELARADQFAMIMAYYLYGLVIETILAVRLISPARRTAAVPH